MQFSITPTLDAASRSAIYASTLPPGRYRLVNLSAQRCGVVCAGSTLEVSEKFSRFDIKDGQLTDLGVIIQAPSRISARGVLLAHDSNTDQATTTEIVRELIPDLAVFLSRPVISWSHETIPAEMPKLFEYQKRISFGLVSPKDTGNGSFIYGSANGILFSWTPGQEPIGHDIGARNSIETTLVTSSGAWLAGGELGTLQMSTDKGRSWQSIRGNLPLGVVVDINQWHDKVIATTLRASKVYIHIADLHSSAWQLLAQYKMDISEFWDVQGVRPQSFLVDDKLLTTLPGRQLAYLDLSRNERVIYPLPGAIQMFSVSQDGVLRCRCQATIAVNPYESHDFGKTWKSSASPRFMSMPAFRDKLHGVAFAGAFLSPGKMAYTSDGGMNWTETTETEHYFPQVFYSADGKAAYAVSPFGVIWSSKDDGRTWAPVPRKARMGQ